MVQGISNNFTPQYFYNNVGPNNQVGQPVSYPNAVPNTFFQAPTFNTMPVADQFVQNVPSLNYQNYNNAETQATTQNIFNQPLYNQAYYTAPVAAPQPQAIDYCPWVQNAELKLALNKLAEITHTPQDIAQLNAMGVTPPFNSGKEALDFICQNQTKVEFGDMGDSLAHAHYVNDENKIVINQKYQGKMTFPMALAIADAIYHEAGHAKDRDGESSVQEELDCLSLNVLGYRHQERAYPQALNGSGEQSRLISDGVGLYPKLFFDNDPSKAALVNRVSEKYGCLPMTSPNHGLPQKQLALRIKESFVNKESAQKA